MLHFIWTIIIGFVAGLIARAVTPGDKGPQGFILTAILGIVGAFAATYLGQAIGWYGPDRMPALSALSSAQCSYCWFGDLLIVVDEFEFEMIHHAAISSCGKRTPN